MEFYSFRFGDMKVAQADAASPKVIGVEMTFGFRDAERHTVELVALTVHVPHDDAKTVTATQQDAYAVAQQLLQAAARKAQSRSADELCDETERNRAFAVKPA
jgi:hypothetical protein